MNVPTRAGLLNLVAKSHPGPPPVETVLRWLEELSEVSSISTWILDAEFPQELEIPADRQQDAFLAALRHFLKPGKTSAGKSGLAVKELSAIRNTIADSSLRVLIT